MKAPRSARSGTAETSALAEIIRLVIATNSTALMTSTVTSGVGPRLQ